ncbi:hypothetical protein TPHA_0G00920 [Tetrapisispora phaffii CBS 4417]|uniref:Chromatin-remodeling ATPase INO80 n=1 Tax=Tetrapisispora phaffii (strain ATCC 24235 / CBS 4417 / NBRC 1672 / NRRL Y-8282 / UCD 70-5) TaxID=1071381 RepID=G8BVK0_TETPH|nr:hypothetical protein TPHA_0G00920 [Tetrapisispora phaffii CBS 4417]CCE63928.1 hypothetical protein TPHA_0G00920 [Tetrapisispora phaffii CBS 4417]
MSLAALLNDDDGTIVSRPNRNAKIENIINSDDAKTDQQVITNIQPIDNESYDKKSRFLNKLNKNFKKLNKLDDVEMNSQNWNFLNLQEFELIMEWQLQSKDWNSNEENMNNLLKEMKFIKNEWKNYNKYLVAAATNASHLLEDKQQSKKTAKNEKITNGKNSLVASKSNKRTRTESDANDLVNDLTIDDVENNVNEKDTEVSGILDMENNSADEDQEKEEDLENEDGIADEEDEEDEEDDEFEEDREGSSAPKGTAGKLVTIHSDASKIVKELIKMCNRSKINKVRKRRFTNASIIDYVSNTSAKTSKKTPKLVLKITLKQYHVKKLKRLINEAKRLKELELKQKEQEEKEKLKELEAKETHEQANKKRKLNPNDSNESDDNEDTATKNNVLVNKHGLHTYGMDMTIKEAKSIKRHYDNTLFTIWKDLARKDSSKLSRLVIQLQSSRSTNIKKTSSLCAREAKKWQQRNFKQVKDLQTKARRGIREMSSFWKKNEREERDLKKKAEKVAIENARKEEEVRENKRQAKKLNFLLTQTELYSHFIGSKIKTDELEGNMKDDRFNGTGKNSSIDLDSTEAGQNDFRTIDFDNEDDEQLRLKAAQNASNVLQKTREKTKQFDNETSNGEELNFQNPTSLGDITIEQPDLLACTLKEYQLKGLNWLANLYDQGINGILADEMGLGKTVQSISVLAHLAEKHNIWGPFLVVTPASTLHNWVNEISKFVPQFKILPYWGNSNDRKILRRFWDRKNLRYTKDSPFHVMITSYQMVVSDSIYIQKMKWQYMILDEAQAIKSSQSSRWKNLLNFYCRNRLLLTGTPIQNNMQELWALLHFIMPSLFDSHDEFNDWFSKDIESHAEANTQLNQQQLRRLHMILKPFMLRRVKKNVQSELGEKIEIDVMCDLTQRQAKLYQILKSQMSSSYNAIENAAGAEESGSDQNMINAVMQFRKVCNHPDLFERYDIDSPFSFSIFGKTSSLSKIGDVVDVMYSTKNPINFYLPRLIYDELIVASYNNDLDVRNKLLNYTMNIFNNAINSELCQYLSRLLGITTNDIQRIVYKNIINNAILSNLDPNEFLEKLSVYNDSEGNYLENKFEQSLRIIDKSRQLDCLKRTTTGGVLDALMNIQEKVYEENYFNSMQRGYRPNASATPVLIQVLGSNNAAAKQKRELFDPVFSQAFADIPPITQYRMLTENKIPIEEFPVTGLYPEPLNKKFSSYISMPSMDRFITESAKLKKLDELLVNLKKGDHRVLIYFQMTKMMDLMEEYLIYRQYNHIRLDGSSKLEDRRDLVHDWQTRPEIFIFLLSTRAGGLGINLTAADTVIFYDSDWNPTIDSQAMDRAHRLGQTRQVTVYRLLVRDTIEERMRDRAKQKEHVQQVVMEGKTKENTVKTIEATSEPLHIN